MERTNYMKITLDQTHPRPLSSGREGKAYDSSNGGVSRFSANKSNYLTC